MEWFFKIQFVENVLVCVSGVFNFSFCYCFYKGFIPKIILVGQFLPFNLQIWHWNPPWFMCSALTENFEQTTTECSFFMPDFISHVFLKYFSFHTLLIMICWKSTEVLLNLVGLLDSPVSSLDFEQINVFWTSGFHFASFLFESLSVNRKIPELYFSHEI